MVEVLSGFHLNKDSDSVSGFIGEEDIIIQSASLGNQNPITPHSEFTLVGSQNAYVVGINGLMDGHFLCDNVSYNGFFYSDPDLSQHVIDAEKSANRSWDKFMCWAATDSNLLYRTGWLTSSTLTVDNVFDDALVSPATQGVAYGIKTRSNCRTFISFFQKKTVGKGLFFSLTFMLVMIF